MTHGNLGHNSFPFNRRENDILPFFTETHIFPWTSLSFWISVIFGMKNGMAAVKLFIFFAFLRFAKHLRIGNHLLLSCKQANRTGQKRERLASWPAFGPNLPQAAAPGMWRTPGNGFRQAFCKRSGVRQENKAQLQGAGVVQQVVKWDMGLCQSH